MSTRTNLSKSSPRRLQVPRSQRTYTEDEVKNVLRAAASSGRKVSEAVVPLFAACNSADSAEQAQQLRRVIFEACVTTLKTNLQTQDAKDLIVKLLIEVDALDGETLVTLAELLIKEVKSGQHQALDLFPKLLAVIASKKSIEYRKENGAKGEIGGAAQKGHLLSSLCGCRWEEGEGCVQHIAHISQEIPMSSDELQFLIDKILRVMKGIKVTELPPLVYQLLVLSVKGHRATVLNGVRALFSHLDEEILENSETEEDSVVSVQSSKRELLQTEGTVILHITNALKHDQELRKVFTKSLKVSQSCLSPGSLSLFNLALVLSLARLHMFEDAVFGFMKEVVLRSYREQERMESSLWMQEMYQAVPNVEDMLLDVVDHSVSGWDHVVRGVFLVGFFLMETFGSKTAFTSHGPQYKACCLGSKVLYRTFQVHVMVREELVTQLVNRILSNASTFAGHYTELLTSLVEHYHQAALDSLPKLKEAFSCLSLLPPQPALELLHAVLPLVKLSVSLRDCLLLVLRKSLFSRMMEPRKIAVAAYLMLLRKFTVLDAVEVGGESTQSSLNGSQSQVMVEVHGAGSSSSGHRALCLEILGVLRRALTKQYDVRLSLYEGLCTVFYTNSKLAEPIMDLLWGQFELYYESGQDTVPPLTLSSCLTVRDDQTALVEPLDVLLQCMQLCVFKYWEWEERMEGAGEEVGPLETPEVIEVAKSVLASVVERMVKSEPEDFELDKSSDFSAGSSVGQKNRVMAKLVINIYETLLEFTFTIGEFSQASIEQTLKLFQGRKRIADILLEKGPGGGAGAKKVGGASSALKSNFTLQFLVRILRALFNDNMPGHQQPLKVLRDNTAFCRYMVTTAVVKSHQIQEKGTCDGAFADFRPNKLFKLCCLLARIFFQQIDISPGHAAKKDKGKSVPVLCLEGLSSLLYSAVSRYGDQALCGAPSSRGGAHPPSNTSTAMPLTLENFLCAINPSLDSSASRDERLHFLIRHLQRLVSVVVDASVKDWSLKEVMVMVNLIGLLAGQLQRNSSELMSVFEWVNAQCKEQNIGDVHVTKAFVSLLLTLNARLKAKGSVKMLVKLCLDVHYHLGDIDEDVELESSPHYTIVSRETAPNGILALLYTHLELMLGDADWLTARLKTCLATDLMEEILDRESSPMAANVKELFSSLCSRLTLVVSGLNELVQTLLTTSPNINGLVKLITKFFTVMGNLAKYCLVAYQQTSYIAPHFKSLVNEVGAHLSQQVYSFLTYIQSPQMQSGLGGPGEGSAKKGKGKQSKGKGKASAADGIKGGKARIRKETRSFPSLIFAMEQFEKLLIQLGKKSKENLMEGFKRSLARDFRIDLEAMENEMEGDGEGGESDCSGGSTEGQSPPPAKRSRAF